MIVTISCTDKRGLCARYTGGEFNTCEWDQIENAVRMINFAKFTRLERHCIRSDGYASHLKFLAKTIESYDKEGPWISPENRRKLVDCVKSFTDHSVPLNVGDKRTYVVMRDGYRSDIGNLNLQERSLMGLLSGEVVETVIAEEEPKEPEDVSVNRRVRFVSINEMELDEMKTED